jgi:hypothetical protein
MGQRDNDRLGRRGQSIFKGWLEDSDLIPQPPESDRLGWDFLVEFQPIRRLDVPLDQQDDLKKAFVQVKSTSHSAKSVRGKLSAFKALVDTDFPAFVALLELAHGKNISRARLLHIGEQEIEIILKRAREIEASGNVELLRIKISLPLATATEIDTEGSNLASAILNYIGPNTSDYIQRKARVRRECGYNDGSRTIKISWTGLHPVWLTPA